MPIITDAPGAPPRLITKPLEIAAPEYQSTQVDTRFTPLKNLLTHINGMEWTVDYYSQIIDVDNVVAGQRVSSSGVYQQYQLVKEFEFKVTEPLSLSQDPEGRGMVYVGEANIYPILIPNVGDMFTANIGDGRLGIFQITGTDKKSIYKEATYTVEYQQVDYVPSARFTDLESKVINTTVFVRDFMMYGQNPVLQEEEYVVVQDLQDRLDKMSKDYWRTFFSHEFKTIIMPGQSRPVYDHFLTTALMKAFTTWDAPEVLQCRLMNVGDDPNLHTQQFWEMILALDDDLRPMLAQEMGLVWSKQFTRDPMLESFYHSGIEYAVYPKNTDCALSYEYGRKTKPLAPQEIVEAAGRMRNPVIPDPTAETDPTTPTPLINPILVDSYYVFSQAFYEKTEGQSQLELLVADALVGKALDNRILLALCKDYQTWGGLEMFYYLPIVIMLIKTTIRSV